MLSNVDEITFSWLTPICCLLRQTPINPKECYILRFECCNENDTDMVISEAPANKKKQDEVFRLILPSTPSLIIVYAWISNVCTSLVELV
jgi:hypothetical protein